MSQKKQPPRRQRRPAPRVRYEVRLNGRQHQRLERMGQFERRHFAAYFRKYFDQALDAWEQDHPRTEP